MTLTVISGNDVPSATAQMLREQLADLEEHAHVIEHYLAGDTLVVDGHRSRHSDVRAERDSSRDYLHIARRSLVRHPHWDEVPNCLPVG